MLKSVQAGRGLAAVIVLLGHLGAQLALPKYFAIPVLEVPFGFGHAGVEFFFVLSGFLITHVHFNHFGDPRLIGTYARKRLIRIYPAYWVVFGLVYFAALAIPATRGTVPHNLHDVLSALSLVPRESLDRGGPGSQVILVAWTLQYEMTFYTLMGFFILSIPLGAILSGGLLLIYLFCDASSVFPLSFIAKDWILLFGLGALVAILCRKFPGRQHSGKVAVAGALLFGGVALQEILTSGQWNFFPTRALTYGLASALMLWGIVNSEQRGHVFGRSHALQQVGAASYSLYLIHFPVISILSKAAISLGASGVLGAAVTYVITLVVVFVLAIVFHRRIEIPLIEGLNKRFASKTPHALSD